MKPAAIVEDNMTRRAATQNPNRAAICSLAIASTLAVCLFASGAAAQDRISEYAAIIAALDRTDVDRQTDQRRDPLKLLVFTGAQPGMKVLDMGAGGGYSTELMARAVAPTGVVYGQNPGDLGERAKTRFETRLQTPAGKNIVSLRGHLTTPYPPTWAISTLSPSCSSTTTPPT
jgi:predicted methyltransferase